MTSVAFYLPECLAAEFELFRKIAWLHTTSQRHAVAEQALNTQNPTGGLRPNPTMIEIMYAAWNVLEAIT